MLGDTHRCWHRERRALVDALYTVLTDPNTRLAFCSPSTNMTPQRIMCFLNTANNEIDIVQTLNLSLRPLYPLTPRKAMGCYLRFHRPAVQCCGQARTNTSIHRKMKFDRRFILLISQRQQKGTKGKREREIAQVTPKRANILYNIL